MFYLPLKYFLWVPITFLYIIVLPTSLIVIRNRPSKGGYVCPLVSLSKPVVSRIEEEAMSLSGFHYKLYFCFYSLSLSQFQPIFRSFVAISAALCRCFKALFFLSKFSLTEPKESGQNKCNQRKPTEGWSYTKHYCCMGQMGLKSENEKRSVRKRRYH